MISIINSFSTSIPECLPLGTGIEGLSNPDELAITDSGNWLKEHRLWGELPEQVLQDIAQIASFA